VVALCLGGGVFIELWSQSGAHQLPLSVAVQRFHSAAPGPGHEALRPAQGVYQYSGTGTEHLSVPPKTQSEGPIIPSTVAYQPHGCWSFRLDFSDNHWQSYTYCPQGKALLLTARSGWYQWDFVVTTIGDTETLICRPTEDAIPAALAVGPRHSFSCRGTNSPLSIPPVTMAGWVEYIGRGTVTVQGRRLQALQMKEVATFSGGQTGTDSAETWVDATTGLPLRGTWSTVVRTPSPLGSSTLTAGGRFALAALTPNT